MTKQEFIEELQEIFEKEHLTQDQDLTALPEFDSLAVMSIVALVFARFKIKLSGSAVKNIKNIRELTELIGVENFGE